MPPTDSRLRLTDGAEVGSMPSLSRRRLPYSSTISLVPRRGPHECCTPPEEVLSGGVVKEVLGFGLLDQARMA
jgi:hypothetical protein